MGLAYLKLAVIAEGIAHRARAAASSEARGCEAATAVEPLIAAGHSVLS